MDNCLFCKFISNVFKTDKVYEDDKMIIIRDIEPKAELHYLLIPKRHYAQLSDMGERDTSDLGACLFRLAELQDFLKLDNGYRLIINQGADAGQTILHLHVHILGGHPLPFDSLKPKMQ